MPATEDEDLEVAFPHIQPAMESQLSSLPGELDYSVVLTKVQRINNQLGDMNVDNEKIRSVCDGLLRDYQIRDEAIANFTRLVKETVDRPAPLDETAMNVAQELANDELYDYDILVKLLGDRFDPVSWVSASDHDFMAG